MADAPTVPNSRGASSRFVMIDGLRGVAALSVAIQHFNGTIALAAPNWLPAWLASIATRGYLGVDVFFVLSGFVIAFSVRDGEYSGRYLGLFALRRSIRLDPPYWVAIFVEVLLVAVSGAVFPSVRKPMPSGGKLFSHFIYAQDILGYGGISPVFWTLCYEIQFYLLLVVLLVLWRKTQSGLPSSTRKPAVWLVLAGLFVASLEVRFGPWHLPIRGLALERWYEFFLGVLAWWVVSGRLRGIALVGACTLVTAVLMVARSEAINLLPVVVSGSIVLAGRAGRLNTLLGNRVLQYLGRTSYSLYLLHGPIGGRWISLLEKVLGSSFGIGWAYFAFASACAISFAASSIAWRLLEAPTIRLSKRIRLPSRAEERTAPAFAEPAVVTA
jgi:peptidoglycan/LPS O-acetylase OafA/YrhL